MNDRFKFRVWNKRTEEMLDVRLISYFSTGNICRVEAQNAVGDIKILDDYKTSIEDIELMQCTGLKDKNGKLLFEGDVVNQNNTIYSVNWCDGSFCFKDALNGKNYTVEFVMSAKLEVIGNIYQDKELLNEN